MIKKLKCFFLLMLFPLALFAQSTCGNLSYADSKLKKIKDKGYITIATITDNPPFYWSEHGKLRGYDHEVMQNIAHRLGVSLRVIAVPPGRAHPSVVDLVQGGQADLAMANLRINQQDAQQVFFTDSYIEENLALLVSRRKMHKHDWGQSFSYFSNKSYKMAVVKHSLQERLSKKIYPKSIQAYFANYKDSLRGVVAGGADIMFLELQRALYLLVRNPGWINQAVIIKTGRKERIGFAVNYADLRLKQWLDFYIRIGRASKLGFLAQMHHAYFYSGERNEGV